MFQMWQLIGRTVFIWIILIFLWNHTMPVKSSAHMSSRKQPGKSKSKKTLSNPTPSYRSVQKTVKDSKKKHGKSKNTTDNYDGNVRRGKGSLQHLLWRRLKVVMDATAWPMESQERHERALWIPTSIKPLLVHQLNVHLLLLPCSLHRNASPRNAGNWQHLLSMLPFCTTMIWCELNKSIFTN